MTNLGISEMTLNINALSGHLCTVTAKRDDTVARVKHLIAEETSIPALAQGLVAGYLKPGDNIVLSTLALDEKSIDFFMVRRRPEIVQWIETLREGYCESPLPDTSLQKKELIASVLRELPSGLVSDHEFMLAMTQENGYAIEYAVPDLQSEPEFVFAAILNGYPFSRLGRRAGKSLLENRRLLKSMLQEGDRDLVLAAIQQDFTLVEFLPTDLLDDKEVILTAVRLAGRTLRFASATLQGDREVVLTAVQQTGFAIQYASQELQRDSAIVAAAVGQDGRALQTLSPQMRADRDVVLIAVANNGFSLQFASSGLRADPEVVSAAVRSTPASVQFAAKPLQLEFKK